MTTDEQNHISELRYQMLKQQDELRELRAECERLRRENALLLADKTELGLQVDALLPADKVRLLNIARGCHDYGGGYHESKDADIFHHGIQTVINALEGADKNPNDTQAAALERIGAREPEVVTSASTGKPPPILTAVRDCWRCHSSTVNEPWCQHCGADNPWGTGPHPTP